MTARLKLIVKALCRWSRLPEPTWPRRQVTAEPQAGSESRPHRSGFAARTHLYAAALAITAVYTGSPAYAANPDKPEKPDKVQKPDKSEKPDKIPKSQRGNSSVESAGRPDRANGKSSRSERTEGGAASFSSGRGPAAAATAAFEPFQAIAERNIFNPNRVPKSRGDAAEPPRVDTVALVGVLQSEEGVLAFFHSEDRRLQQIVREGETLGGLSVMKITPGGVQLMQEGEPLFLRVNQQMRRVEGGSWKPLPRDTARAEIARASDGTPLPVIPPGASEVLRRLMEQRQKQLKQ